MGSGHGVESPEGFVSVSVVGSAAAGWKVVYEPKVDGKDVETE
jgi:hypothetical protein